MQLPWRHKHLVQHMLVLGLPVPVAVQFAVSVVIYSQSGLDLWCDSTKTLFMWSNEHWTGVDTSSGTLLFFVCGIKGMGVGE